MDPYMDPFTSTGYYKLTEMLPYNVIASKR